MKPDKGGRNDYFATAKQKVDLHNLVREEITPEMITFSSISFQ